jgi:predicted RND superfamily exporter protein
MHAFPIRHRLPVILISIGIMLIALIPLTQLHINSDLESYMPDSMESKRNNKLIANEFASAENLMIVLTAPDVLSPEILIKIRQLSDDLQQLPTVKRIHSLFHATAIHHEEGFMMIEPAIVSIPATPTEQEKLRISLSNNDLVAGLILSNDFQSTLLMLEIERDSMNPTADQDLIQQVREVLSSVSALYPTDSNNTDSSLSFTTYLTGQPYLRAEANQQISRDMLVLLPVGLCIMLLFLWFSFRDIKAVILPFTVVVFSIIISMALLPAFGWELSLIGILIPIMMIAIANNYGIHVIARYQELTEAGQSVNQALDSTVKHLRRPVWLCGLTTIAGTLGLTAHLLIPARQMGVISALGIAFALTMSLTYLPAVMSYFNKGIKQIKTKTENSRKTLTDRTVSLINHRPYLPLLLAGILIIFSIIGISRIAVAPDSSKILPQQHEFNQAIHIADQEFGGSKLLQIMIKGDARDPQLLNAIDSAATHIKQHPLVGNTASLGTLIKKMHGTTTIQSVETLPNSREAIAQYLELYGMSADIDDYERFINFNYSQTLLTVQYRSASLTEVNKLHHYIESSLLQHNLDFVTGGVSLIDKEISESVRTGQISSLVVAFIAILTLLSIIFRSIVAGLIGSIPLVVAVICTFGFMGWTGIELDIVTALLSSISIGLGVDFTIHIFWRMKYELGINGGNWHDAIFLTLSGTGRGITINAFSVVLGFSALLLSTFPFVQAFGVLIILSVLLCLASALLIIPIICHLLKPRFLYSY